MVLIGVISDTHLRYPTDEFKSFIERTFGQMDMILHAGDMTSIEVYEFLKIYNLKAVRGNMDDFQLRSLLPDKLSFEIEGLKFGLIHGQGAPFGIEHVVLKEFDNVDVIVFGHSHVPKVSKIGEVHLFNPGSFKKPYSPPPTVGILRVEGKKIEFDHIPVTGL
ncbi:MAG: metallophosphoesterase [Desulfobacterota bacterium]|nr:metallophosphoesterase [Thermodesulfobacteriota bacterium]MDW8002301.1 metallophosphoesterase [Deltaproteobacteria bacterium]